MSWTLLIAVLALGAGIGFVSGAFGKGGSAIATPLLHAIGIAPLPALASPLPAGIPSTLLASRSYVRAGHLDRRVLRIGVLIGVPATIVGAITTRWIPGNKLVLAADVLVLVLGLRVLISGAAHDDVVVATRTNRTRVIGVIGAVGIVSGLLGNTGGFLLAPLFMRVLRMPIRDALGTSLVLSAALAVPGTIVHAALGHIDWALAATFGLGSIPLATLGARVALQSKERTLTLAFGATLTMLATAFLVFAH